MIRHLRFGTLRTGALVLMDHPKFVQLIADQAYYYRGNVIYLHLS